MQDARAREMLVGIMMLAAGTIYLYLTTGVPRRGTIDAAFIPYVLAFAMVALGLAQTFVAWRRTATDVAVEQNVDEETPTQGKPNYATVVKTLLLFAGFTVLIRPLGFPVAAAIYLFLQFIVLTPADRKPNYLFYLVLAPVCAAVIFVSFRYGFDLILPAGPLTRYLP
jgi:putative tricarboxylic transport membrane protein